MRRAFDEPGTVLAYHNSTLIDEDGAVLGRVFKNRSARFAPLTMRPWMIIPGHAQMISRSLLRFNSLHANSIDPYCPNEPMPHDQWFAFWASVLGETFYISDCLAQYRQHPENTSGWPHIGLTAYILDHISNAANYVSGESLGAENRLNLLHQCHALLAPGEIELVENACAYFEALCARSKIRFAVYSAKTIGGRAHALLTLLKRGDYIGKVPDTFDLPALLLDAAVGLPFGHRKNRQ